MERAGGRQKKMAGYCSTGQSVVLMEEEEDNLCQIEPDFVYQNSDKFQSVASIHPSKNVTMDFKSSHHKLQYSDMSSCPASQIRTNVVDILL